MLRSILNFLNNIPYIFGRPVRHWTWYCHNAFRSIWRC